MSNSSADDGDLPPDIPPDSFGTDSLGPGRPGQSGGGQSAEGEKTHAQWREVFDEAETGLRRFLAGKLPQSADVEDCLQSVLVAMLKNESEIPPAARKAWLFRVAANEAARWWRHKSTTDRVLEKHAQTAYSVETELPSHLETQETLQRVHQAIEQLSENARQVVRLRLRDGMTFQSIADQLQLPLGTVLTRMRRAMEQLRKELDDGDNEGNEIEG